MPMSNASTEHKLPRKPADAARAVRDDARYGFAFLRRNWKRLLLLFVGLPTCFADLGVTEVTPEKVMKVAIGATAEGETIHNMPFPVTAEMVCGAIFAADKLGAHA